MRDIFGKNEGRVTVREDLKMEISCQVMSLSRHGWQLAIATNI
jgi:hypothetical protein